ncbi:MAG TPA: hypothetical protein VFX49_02085 [Chloroflexota bacterium]|nr:hypothetical protein [Chloroflexota bacterium]
MADLEVLLFLRRRPEAEWNASAVADRLGINRTLAAMILKQLEAGGFLSSRAEPSLLYRYTPRPDLVGALDHLAEIYAEHRMMVAALLAARRSPAGLREFSNAFRLTKRRE